MDERETPDVPPGTNINGAVVEARVKAGGYGTVYRARDKNSGMLLALKFIPLERAEAWARREFLIGLSLHHDNLVQQVGFGYWPDDSPRFVWLKLLFVEGRELDVWAREENPDARTVAGTLLGVARALAVVHEQKVVHRDVKEANILVRERDGEPVLVDFGVAWREGAPTITQGLFPPGTPLYRSPEAWHFGVEHQHERGARYRPGPADDLYALGVVLYRLLTGRFPFEPAWDEPEAVRAVIHHAPLPPHLVNPRVPEPLSTVCLKLLKKKPEERYPSALALHDVLRELRAREEAEWRVPLGEGWRPRRRGRRGAAAREQLEAAVSPLEPTPAAPTTVSVADWRLGDVALQAFGRAALGMVLLLGAALVGWGLLEWRTSAPPTVASPAPVFMSQALRGQEVAPSRPAPEAESAAAPPRVETTPAAVASLAARPEDDALKKKRQAPSIEGSRKQKGTLSPVAKWCAGAAAAAHLACPGAPVRPEAPGRSGPAPEACPDGAVETMTQTLGIKTGQSGEVSFLLSIASPIDYVSVTEGPASVRLDMGWGTKGWGGLPDNTVLQGRLYFGKGRVYGRFTEARTPNGDRYKVCMQLWTAPKTAKRGGGNHAPGLGVEMEPESTPDKVLIWHDGPVESVERFE